MSLTEAEKKKIEAEEKYRAEVRSKSETFKPKHPFPALLSFFIPGLGQVVKGQVGKGILIFLGTGIAALFLLIPGIIVWIWQMIDAYNN